MRCFLCRRRGSGAQSVYSHFLSTHISLSRTQLGDYTELHNGGKTVERHAYEEEKRLFSAIGEIGALLQSLEHPWSETRYQ